MLSVKCGLKWGKGGILRSYTFKKKMPWDLDLKCHGEVLDFQGKQLKPVLVTLWPAVDEVHHRLH